MEARHSHPDEPEPPRKDHPERYLKCLDLLSNKVPLDAIDTWFCTLDPCETLNLKDWGAPKCQIGDAWWTHNYYEMWIQIQTCQTCQICAIFPNMSRHVQVNINQGMTILLVLQEFSGVEFFAPQPYKFTTMYLTDPSISPSECCWGQAKGSQPNTTGCRAWELAWAWPARFRSSPGLRCSSTF